MMGIGFPELMIILVIIMIIFGAGKLPEIGSAFGNSIKNFKKSMKEAEEIQEATNLESTETSEGSDGSEPSEGETTKEPAPAEDAKENYGKSLRSTTPVPPLKPQSLFKIRGFMVHYFRSIFMQVASK